MTGRVRRLVDAGERGEHDAWPMLANPVRDFSTDLPVDLEPPGHIPGEVRARGARYEAHATADALATTKPPTNHAQCADRRSRELEERRCGGIEIGVDVAHLGPDVAPAVAE